MLCDMFRPRAGTLHDAMGTGARRLACGWLAPPAAEWKRYVTRVDGASAVVEAVEVPGGFFVRTPRDCAPPFAAAATEYVAKPCGGTARRPR